MAKIRRLEEDDLNLVFADFKTRYPNNPLIIRREYFDWQFFDAQNNRYSAFCAWDDDKYVGFMGYEATKVACDGKVYDAGFPMQWFSVNRDGTGLVLFRTVRMDVEALLFLLCSDDSYKIFQKMGMVCFDDMPRWVGILKPSEAAESFGVDDKSFLAKAQHSTSMLANISPGGEWELVTRLHDDRDYFVARQGTRSWVLRTGKYLNHRYVDIPGHNYVIAASERGVGVWRIEPIMHSDKSVVRILEWTFLPNDPAAHGVMSEIVSQALSANAVLIDFYCTAEAIGESLEQFGMFREQVYGEFFIPRLFRPISFDPELLRVNGAVVMPDTEITPSEMYITRGDSDIDRLKV